MEDLALLEKSNFRPDEAAAVMKLSKRTVYRMVNDGRLEGLRKPGSNSLWIPRAAVLAKLGK